MECNKRNRNIRYAILRDSHLNRIYQTEKVFSVFEPIILLNFWHICQNEMSHFFGNGSFTRWKIMAV